MNSFFITSSHIHTQSTVRPIKNRREIKRENETLIFFCSNLSFLNVVKIERLFSSLILLAGEGRAGVKEFERRFLIIKRRLFFCCAYT